MILLREPVSDVMDHLGGSAILRELPVPHTAGIGTIYSFLSWLLLLISPPFCRGSLP